MAALSTEDPGLRRVPRALASLDGVGLTDLTDMSEIDDVDLLRGAASGDWQCIGTLYDRHRDGALAVATSVLSDPSEAEDVVHDAFVDLPRMARSFDPSRGRLTQWLYRGVRNRAIDHVRRRTRWVSRMAPSASGPETLLAMLPQRGSSPLDEAEAQELLDLVARLDGRHAHLVRLAFVEGWSHSAIAHMTGLPLGTVKTRIRNSLGKLRLLMAEPDLASVPRPEDPEAVVVVCTPDRRLARSVAAHVRGLARVDVLDALPGSDLKSSSVIVVDLRTSSLTIRQALDELADAGLGRVPVLLLPPANEKAVLPPSSRVIIVDAGDPPRLDLRSALLAVLTASSADSALREVAMDRLLQQDGWPIIIADRLGRVTEATPAAALLFGRTPRQLEGIFLTDLSAIGHDDTERQWQRLAATGWWAGRWIVRRPTSGPLTIWVRAWLPPGGGFVGVYAPEPVLSARPRSKATRGRSARSSQTPGTSQRRPGARISTPSTPRTSGRRRSGDRDVGSPTASG